MLEQSERMAIQYLPESIEVAKRKMLDTLTVEIERLVALKKVNPAVRDCELIFLEQQRTESLQAIEKADSVLQAVRLIIISDE